MRARAASDWGSESPPSPLAPEGFPVRWFCVKVMPDGRTAGTLGVIVALSDHDGLLALVAEYAIASGEVAFPVQSVGRGIVTIKPVPSTVGETAVSLEVAVTTASAGRVEPAGEREPV